jgi:hypothetical protein
LDELRLQPGSQRPGWGMWVGKFRKLLSKIFAIELLRAGR